MIRSSFASFTTARLAIQASQSALAVVGQNMANVKTTGYTRQRLDQVSLNSKGLVNCYQSIPQARIGYGVMVTGVSQIRDPFLDTRYRVEMGNLGGADKTADLMDKIGQILDETAKNGSIKDNLKDFATQLGSLSTGKAETDTLVRSSSETLTSQFRQYAKRLSDLRTDVENTTKSDVKDINQLLKDIKSLNESIKESQSHGSPALELQDERNQKIDALATYVNIKVTYTTNTSVTGAQVDELKIDMIGDSSIGPDVINLINDTKEPAQFDLVQRFDDDGKLSLQVKDTLGGTHSKVESDKGTIQSALDMLNKNGEYDDPPTRTRGIGYYQKALDNLANVFAQTFNDLNTASANDPADPNKKIGGPLFSTTDASGTFTAANITISDEWLDGTVHILNSRDPNAASGDKSNLLNMISTMDKTTNFKSESGFNVYTGSFYDCFDNIGSVQSTDQKSAENMLDNYLSITSEIANSKESVSGVNLDEEAMNMMQYNSSLTAASRLMTALDECLNTIISSMGIAGR